MHQIIWGSITPIIALDLLHDNLEMTTTSLLYLGNKDIEEIQKIMMSTKAANMAKQIIGQTIDLAMQTKKRSDSH